MHQPNSRYVLAKGVKALKLVEQHIRYRCDLVGVAAFHKNVASHSPKTYSTNHVLTNAEVNNRLLVSKNKFRGIPKKGSSLNCVKRFF